MLDFVISNMDQAYLLMLMALEKRPTFQRVAVRCMCDLLIAIPHFNFRENLLASIVRNISSPDDVIRFLYISLNLFDFIVL